MLHYHGNIELLNFSRIGFLSSQTDPFFCDHVLSDFISHINKDEIIITPGHSYMEKQMMALLLNRETPFIWVLARGIPDSFNSEITKALEGNKLLIISPFEKEHSLITGHRSMMRNRFIIETANRLTIGYVRKGGLLEELLEDKTFIQLYK